MNTQAARTHHTVRLRMLFFTLLLLLGSGAAARAQIEIQVLVVANPGLAASDLSRAQLRDVFTGASSSIKGSAQVTPVLLREGPAHDEFLSIYVGKSDAAFRAGWRSLLFSGQGVLPRTLNSDADVVEYVAHTPGAIGYIARTSPHPGVKILAVR
jgi:ABC-type phosphate transport system substrate-binding protein